MEIGYFCVCLQILCITQKVVEVHKNPPSAISVSHQPQKVEEELEGLLPVQASGDEVSSFMPVFPLLYFCACIILPTNTALYITTTRERRV